MKLKKICFRVIISAMAILMSIGLFQNAKAMQDLSTKPKYFGVRILRKSGMGYAIGNPKANGVAGNSSAANIWDIQEFESKNSGVSGKDVNAYCIKSGIGFANVNDIAEYNVAYDFKTEKNEILELNSSVLNSVVNGQYYNHLLAMADLLYLPGVSTEYEKEKLLIAAGCDDDFDDDGQIDIVITDDEIEAIQQAAIWYYTNYGEENGKYDKTDEEMQWFNYTQDADVYEALMNYNRYAQDFHQMGQYRAEQAINLYKYLIQEAQNNANAYEQGTAKSKTRITLYTSKTSTDKTQPIIIIERDPGEFDLALRKYITKITTDGKTVELSNDDIRVPNIDESTLTGENENKTATYKHRKDPVEVKTGSIVTYKITIYNEGDIAGKATKVVDILPEGLKYEKVVNGNFVLESDTDNILTFKRNDSEKENFLKPYEAGKLQQYSETIEIQCKVTATADTKNDKILTNVAYIAEAVADGENQKDRDSQPGTVIVSDLPNYKGTTNEDDLSKKEYYPGQEDDDDFEKLVIKAQPEEPFDLALRKYITKVTTDGKTTILEGETSRVPNIDESTITEEQGKTTATYKHRKDPVEVKEGSVVTYKITIYNEGKKAGRATKVVDVLPEGLIYKGIISGNFELESNEGNVVTLKRIDSDTTNLTPYESGDLEEHSETIEIECTVTATPDIKNDKVLTNVAYIAEALAEGEEQTDRDSKPTTVPNTSDLPNYKGTTSEDDLSKKEYYPGQEDDDDFEKLVIKPKKSFDLALRKFITQIGEMDIKTRVPVPAWKDDDIVYEHDKTALKVTNGDIVIYTIRVYNEGQIAGYAQEITDDIPEGLEFLPEDSTNVEMGWKMIDDEGNETNNVKEAKKVTTDYLSREKGEEKNLLKAFDKEAGVSETNPDHRDVKIAFKVIEPNTSKRKIINSAQISEDADENGNPVEDVDSTPDEWKEGEDDQDQESIVLQEFDLALRKFITQIGDQKIETREPKPVYENGKITYEHDKTPLEVEQGSIVTYTIRVYNEGETAGYAQEITDDIPEGLEYLPQDETNVNMRWKMIDSEGKETEDVTKAVKVTTDYLSKEQGESGDLAQVIDPEIGLNINPNLLHAFDKDEEISETNPEYKDVQIVFKVVKPNTSNTTIINSAQISEDADKNGDPVDDIDSTPDEWKEGEDDQDQEFLKLKPFDLALRKFITKKGKESITTRIPKPVYENGKITYEHDKTPLEVEQGSIVTYTIRVYNEGETAGYAQEITDDIPEGLEYLPQDETNIEMRWKMIDSEGKETEDVTKAVKVTTDYLSKEQGESEDVAQVIDPETGLNINPNLLHAFDKDEEISETNPEYKDVQIVFKVVKPNTSNTTIINSAQISEDADKNGDPVDDIDSTPDEWKEGEDDQDQEFLELKSFDLALRKFITKIFDATTLQEQDITTRVPKPKLENNDIVYEHSKDAVNVDIGDIITYTIRVFNEGDVAGYAQEVTDDIPEGLEFLPQDETNIEMRWKMIDSEGKETKDVMKAVKITTDYLSKEQGESRISKDSENSESQENENPNLLKAFNKEEEIKEGNPDYRDVNVVFRIKETNSSDKIIINSAQISEDADENGNPVEDVDSTPDEWKDGEDDQDQEAVNLNYFDLALRKFITKVGEQDITTRVPVPKLQNDSIVYEHSKDPINVVVGDIITYTIRVYNEGTLAGYAQEVTDDIPDGLEFLPDNSTNTKMRWKMIDSEGKETKDVTKAVKITTDYLSKEQGESRISENTENSESQKKENPNLLKAFNKEEEIKEGNPDYRDVVVAFKVKETSENTIVNSAQISEDADENGDPVEDVDSTPDEWKDGEDDQDQETVKKTYFDLSLKKWVTQTIVIENGKQTVTQTGHTPDMNPEPLVKIEIHRNKLNNVTVKFRYTIRVTNEGDIEGYAKEITDYVPSGLKFVAQDNPGWTDKGNNVVSTRALENTLLQPGQSADVEILLTWINGEDNMGQKTNTAEITEDYNDRNVPDRDSTPNNKKPGEDDMDDAPILLSVQTGQERIYYALIFTILLTTVGGITLIKKFVL